MNHELLKDFYHQNFKVAGEQELASRTPAHKQSFPTDKNSSIYRFPLARDFVLACITGIALLHQTYTVGGTSELIQTPVSEVTVFTGSQYGQCLVEAKYGYCPIPSPHDNPWLEIHTAVRNYCWIIDRNGRVNTHGSIQCPIEEKHQ